MIEQVCAHIHNYFPGDRFSGRFVVEDGVLRVEGLEEGAYFRVCGSRFNDGVYRAPAEGLADEAFDGVIWEMRPPKGFLKLVQEIEGWQARYGAAADSPYQSENVIGVYAYAKGGEPAGGWRRAFAERLNEWRRMA